MLVTRRHAVLGIAATLALPAVLAPGSAGAAAPVLKMGDLYSPGGELSKVALDNRGKEIALQGFMAPPLKADSKFFVLTNVPMAICPFCADIAEWPEDIVVIYSKRAIEALPFDVKMQATGKLELGPWIDPATGFVSKVRLVDAEYRGLPTVTRQDGPRTFLFGN